MARDFFIEVIRLAAIAPMSAWVFLRFLAWDVARLDEAAAWLSHYPSKPPLAGLSADLVSASLTWLKYGMSALLF